MNRLKMFIAAICAAVCCMSCSTQKSGLYENELFSEMVNYSQHYASLFQNRDCVITTKSNTECITSSQTMVDIGAIDDKFIKYVNYYTRHDRIQEWDERAVLEMLEIDKAFDENEKIVLARSMAMAYYVKESYDIILSKANTVEECADEFYQATGRALRTALLELIASLLEPTPYGELLVAVQVCMEIDEAEENYVACRDSVRQNVRPGTDENGNPIID